MTAAMQRRRDCSVAIQLEGAGYFAEPALAAALSLMLDPGRPLLIEGDVLR
jgi:hypothetical protein